ncbi:MAG TPA: phosphate regulon sensor protein PhoR, partial [Myxococcota bacterium]|nr:phosphate regulon sensor protein PhoR [Myxococcota bacterium]
MLSFWWRPLSFALALALLSLLLSAGRPPGTGWALFAAGLAAYLVYHLRQLRKLSAWLSDGDTPVPTTDGLWGDALYGLEKLLRKRQGVQQKAVADLEQMLEATRSLPDGVVILDANQRIQWLNNAAQALLGLSPQRDMGQFILYLVRQSRFGEWLTAEDFSRLLTMECPVAREKTLSLQLVPLPREQKMLLARDISEIALVDAMRRDFVANVSHELRTPITVIVGFLEGFDDMPDPDPAEFRRHIPLMREQSDRIRRLVDDLL